ncbi:MAG: hypothetical protein ACPGU5_02875 [Lishizhenia sp.]
MKKLSLLVFFLGFILSFSFGQDSTLLVQEPLLETTNLEEEKPGALFWISCFIAGVLPWVFIYFMKQRLKDKK